MLMECIECNHFYYNSGGGGECDMPYENTYLRANHIFHTDPIEFGEKYLGLKLMPYQKLLLKYYIKRSKNENIRYNQF